MAINKAKYYPELSYVMDRSILHKRGNIVCHSKIDQHQRDFAAHDRILERQYDDPMTSEISAPETHLLGRDSTERGGIYPELRPWISWTTLSTIKIHGIDM